MCNFISGIITIHKTLYDLDEDSHEYLIEKNKIDDRSCEPEFVRVELIAKDADIFNHVKENWRLIIDQDFIPDWFSEKYALEEMWNVLQERISKRFHYDEKDVKIYGNENHYLIRSSAVLQYNSSAVLRDNSSAVLRDNSSAVLRDNSRAELRNNSRAELWNNWSNVDVNNNSIAVLRYAKYPIIIVANEKIELRMARNGK